MAIAMSKTRQQFPLSTKKVLKKTLASTLAFVIIILFLYGFLTVFLVSASVSISGWLGITTAVVIGLMVFVVMLTYLYQKWYYDVYFYDLTDDFIIIRKGPITPHEITIPYERVQDVYVDQDLLDRIFGIYDVHLSSATISSGMAAHIDGLEKPAADGLRDFLLKTVSARINRNRGGFNLPQTPTANA